MPLDPLRDALGSLHLRVVLFPIESLLSGFLRVVGRSAAWMVSPLDSVCILALRAPSLVLMCGSLISLRTIEGNTRRFDLMAPGERPASGQGHAPRDRTPPGALS